jgi:hypothetical protein
MMVCRCAVSVEKTVCVVYRTVRSGFSYRLLRRCEGRMNCGIKVDIILILQPRIQTIYIT